MLSRWTALFFPALYIMSSVMAHAGPLHDAVKNGDMAGLGDLIAAGEDLEAQDKFVGTALHWAALTDNIEAAGVLIAAGADVNAASRGDGATALHLTAQRGSIGVAASLIEAGANMDARDTAGEAPLNLAAGNDQPAVALLLLEAGADINVVGIQTGLTPLHNAAEGNAFGSIELLIRFGAGIDQKDSSGGTPLARAVGGGHMDAVRVFLELGADVHGARDIDPVFPSTPLELAIAKGLEEIADILRAAGATE